VQLGQLQKIESELIELGYQIIAISPDRPEKLRNSIRDHKLRYKVVSDRKMLAAKSMGLAFRVSENTLKRYAEWGIDLEDASGETHHLLPVPAVFVLNEKAVIEFQFVHPDYRVRLDPEILLAVARKGKAAKLMKE
jgi:peroxiredoxin